MTQCSIASRENLCCGAHRAAGSVAQFADEKKPAVGGLGSAVCALQRLALRRSGIVAHPLGGIRVRTGLGRGATGEQPDERAGGKEKRHEGKKQSGHEVSEGLG